VLSLEVAEHLPAEAAEDFIRSITSLGDVVLFSAAIPFQGGYHHLNEQWPEYWARIFQLSNYTAVDMIRERIWQNKNVYWWYAQNLLIYVNNERVDRYASLRHAILPSSASPLPLVHPERYLALAQRS
jgi:hypothetical protein